MGAGKSSVARELARLCQRRWVDTDRIVVQEAGVTDHRNFRRPRRGSISAAWRPRRCVRWHGSRRLIVATGGGIVTEPANRALLQALGCVVWLTADEDVLFERVSRNDHRPLLQTADPRATLHELLEARRPALHGLRACDRGHLGRQPRCTSPKPCSRRSCRFLKRVTRRGRRRTLPPWT